MELLRISMQMALSLETYRWRGYTPPRVQISNYVIFVYNVAVMFEGS